MAFSGTGSGTAIDPYIILTATHLKEIEDDMTAYYKLGSDITLGTFEPIGYDAGGSHDEFQGQLDGDDCSIEDGTINYSAVNKIGLFCITGSSVVIENLTLDNVDVTGLGDTGGLIGEGSDNLTISNCSIENCTITGDDRVGGLVGDKVGTSTWYISNCSIINSDIVGVDRVAGLTGYSIYINISNCYIDENSSITGEDTLGGLIGYGGGVTMDSCANKGSTMTASGSKWVAGGLIGYMTSGTTTISNSYNKSSLSSGQNVGGLVGRIVGGTSVITITKCYSDGNLSGTDIVGGLIGYFNGGSGSALTKSYALCSTITRTSGSLVTFGRLIGDKASTPTESDNYALSTMVLSY